MNLFTEQQNRLWNQMLLAIDSYEANRIDFFMLVSNLHGAFQVGEFSDKDLIKEWYQLWGALEIHRAVSLDKNTSIVKENVEKDVQSMKSFLINQSERQ